LSTGKKMELSVPAGLLSRSPSPSPSLQPTKPKLTLLPPARVHFPVLPMDSQTATLKSIPHAAPIQDNGSTLTSSSSSPIESGRGRIGEVKRVTKETDVSVRINLDGTGVADSSTGIPFLDHMLDVTVGLK
ncbi:hypothetical protein Tsubulata_000421, partial [Turnera subulata]